MKFTFLGTGTSAGVPVLGCGCKVCRSQDPRDFRYRSCALLESDTTRVLIDCGPDIRMQLMHRPFRKIDGVLLTHIHYDHVGEEQVKVNIFRARQTIKKEFRQQEEYGL